MPFSHCTVDGALGQQQDGVAKPKELSRIFVALFDYDPLSMSPNHDRAVEELSFQEGQILKVGLTVEGKAQHASKLAQ